MLKTINDPSKLKKKLDSKPNRKKIDLTPRAFDYLDDVQKATYKKQKKFIDDIKSEADLKPGRRSNGQTRKDTRTTKGNWGEMKTDQYMLGLEQRWKPMHSMIDDWEKNYGSGIDGIFENLDFKKPPPPTKYIIAESKSFNANLSKTKTKTGFQMDEDWIDARLEDMIPHRKLRREIMKNSSPMLFKWTDVDANPVIELLDESAEVVKSVNYLK